MGLFQDYVYIHIRQLSYSMQACAVLCWDMLCYV